MDRYLIGWLLIYPRSFSIYCQLVLGEIQCGIRAFKWVDLRWEVEFRQSKVYHSPWLFVYRTNGLACYRWMHFWAQGRFRRCWSNASHTARALLPGSQGGRLVGPMLFLNYIIWKLKQAKLFKTAKAFKHKAKEALQTLTQKSLSRSIEQTWKWLITIGVDTRN